MFDNIAQQAQNQNAEQQNKLQREHQNSRSAIQRVAKIFDNFWEAYNNENLYNRDLTSLLKEQRNNHRYAIESLPSQYRKNQPLLLKVEYDYTFSPTIPTYYIDYKNQHVFIKQSKEIFNFQNPSHRSYDPASPPKKLRPFRYILQSFAKEYDKEEEYIIRSLNALLVEIYNQPVSPKLRRKR